MVIKKYIVNNMNEAMTRIRYELGKDAVIISQRKIRKPGFGGLFSKRVIEVTAAAENVTPNNNKSMNVTPNDNKSMEESIEAIKKVMEKDNPMLQNNRTKEIESLDILKEMQEMKNMINDIVPQRKENKTELQTYLENRDVNEDIIKNILGKVNNMEESMDEFEKGRHIISNLINISNVKMEGTVVFVGPTGVGKTTTIAKLAGKLALVDKKKVGLITIDTYRIGAVEQLRTYAEIMNIPFKVVLTTKEMELAIESMKDCDVVLVDTTGRSSKNTMQISELRAFIQKTNTENIHLVLSCTTKDKDINAIVQGYQTLNYNNIIITKLDETTTYGSILNILQSANKPISYIAIGQNVPDDIKRVTVNEIVNLIIGEDCIC